MKEKVKLDLYDFYDYTCLPISITYTCTPSVYIFKPNNEMMLKKGGELKTARPSLKGSMRRAMPSLTEL